MEGSGGCNSTGPPTQASLDSRRGAAHSALGKFTIPRKKRGPENALLEDCLKESREHGGLVSALNECRLDVTGDFFLSWECLDVKLVNNVELAREFSEKRSEMRSKGRHGRELEDRFCFLVTSHTSALELCRNGVETDTSTPHVLGNPACGVHLYRHTDVALKCVTGKAASPRTVVVFKVILGKVKKVPSCVGRKAVHDPTVHFDCFMCRDPSSPRDSLSQQAVGSSVFVFDYNERQELTCRPRQCLPWAVVSLLPCSSNSMTSAISCSPVKLPSPGVAHGAVEALKGCTIAERRGKGENATVIFKHFGSAENSLPSPDYSSPGSSASSPFSTALPGAGLMSGQLYGGYESEGGTCSAYNAEQLWAASYYPAGFMPPFITEAQREMNWVPVAFNPGPAALPEGSAHLGGPVNILAPSSGDFAFGPSPSAHYLAASPSSQGYCDSYVYVYPNHQHQQAIQTPAAAPVSQISTTVITSRVVKDPRLYGREQEGLKRNTGAEARLGTQQNKLHKSKVEQETYRKHPPRREAQARGRGSARGVAEIDRRGQACHGGSPLRPASSEHQEQKPPVEVLKNKFKKYAKYLVMTEKERIASINSLKDMPLAEKELLLRRVKFYDMFFKKDVNCQRVTGESAPSAAEQSRSSGLNLNADLYPQEAPKIIPKSRRTDLRLQTTSGHFLPGTLEIPSELSSGITHDVKPAQDGISVSRSSRGDPSGNRATESCASAAAKPNVVFPQHPAEQPEKATDTVSPKPEIVGDLPCLGTSDISADQDQPNNCEQHRQEPSTYESPYEEMPGLMDISVNTDDFQCEHRQGAARETAGGETEEESIDPRYVDEFVCIAQCEEVYSAGVLESKEAMDTDPFTALKQHLQTVQFEWDAGDHRSTAPHGQGLDDTCTPRENGTGAEESSPCHSKREEAVCKGCEDLCTEDHSGSSDTIYWFLHRRIQFAQMLLTSRQADLKHVNASSGRGDKPSFQITIKADSRISGTTRPQCCLVFSSAESSCDRTKLLMKNPGLVSTAPLDHDSTAGSRGTVSFRAEQDGFPLTRANGHVPQDTSLRNYEEHKAVDQNESEGQRALHTDTDLIHCSGAHGKVGKSPRKTSSPLKKELGGAARSKVTLNQRKKPMKRFVKVSGRPNTTCKMGMKSTALFSKADMKRIRISRQDTIGALWKLGKPPHLRGCVCLKGTLISQTAITKRKKQMAKKKPNAEKSRMENNCISSDKGSEIFPVSQISVNEMEETPGLWQAYVPQISLGRDRSASRKRARNSAVGFPSSEEADSSSDGPSLKRPGPSDGDADAEENDCDSEPLVAERVGETDIGRVSDSPFSAPAAGVDFRDAAQVADLAQARAYGNKEASEATTAARDSVSRSKNSPGAAADKHSRFACTFPVVLNNGPAAPSHVQDNEGEREADIRVNHLEASVTPGENKLHRSQLGHADSLCRSGPEVKMACDSSEEVRLKYEHVDTVIPVPLEVEEKSADSEGKVGTNNTSSCNVMTAGNGKENQTAQGLRARGSNSELTVDLTKTAAVSHGQRTSSEISDSRDKEQRPLGEAGPPSGTYSSPRACSHSSSLKGICSGHLTSSEGAKREDVITGHLQTTCKTLYQRDNQSAIRQAEKFDLSNWESWERSPIKDLEDFVMARSSVIQVNEHYKLQAHGNLEPKVNAEIRAPATGPSSTKSQTDHQSLGLWPAGSSRGQHPVAGESKDAFARSPRAHRPSRNITQGSNTHYQIDSFYTTARLRDHSVTDIDRTLKEVDGATSLQHLHLLRSKCRRMLPSFISTFEGCQCVDFKDAFVSRDLVIERDLGGGASAAPVVLKYRALDSFLELQMMMEAVQFVENKISFLSGDPTFRSLLWSDPTLRRELLEGKEGDRQQPSLFPAFQERLAQRGDNKRRKRHSRPSSPTFSQAKETSYYLYLKNEREKAESQAVLEQCLNREAFSLSTPLSSCINFGDCIEDLELLQKNIVSFMEAQPSQPRGGRDFGKVEQLGVVRRLLQEKISYLRSNKEVDARISWFGLEHILLDAAKTMAWEDLREHRGSGPSDPGKDETRHVINEAATRRLHRLYEKILPGCESETPPCSRAPPRDPHLVTDMQNKEASMEGPIEKDSLSNKERNEDQIRTNKLPEIHQSAATKNSTALPCPVERPESQQVRSHLEAPDLPDRRLSFQQNIQIQALGLRSLMAMHSSHFDAEKEVTETPAAARPVRSSPAVARCPPPKRQSRKPNSRKIRTPASNSVPVPSDVALGPQHKLWRPLPSSQSFTLLPSVLAVGRQGGQGQQPLQKPQPQPLAAVWGSTEARQSRPPWTHPDTQLGSPGIPGPGVPAAPWNGQLQILSAPAQGYWNHAVLPYWSQYQGSTAWTQQLPGAVFSTGRPEPQAEATSYPAFPSTTSSCFYHPQALNCSCPYYTVDSYYLCNEYTYAMDNSPLPAVGNRPLSRFYSDASYSGTGLTPAGKPLKRRLL